MPRTFVAVTPNFGAYLVALRGSWTRGQAASIAARQGLPLSYQALRGLEMGHTQGPEPEVLQAVAALYKVPYEELVLRFVKERYRVELGRSVAPNQHTPRYASPTHSARVRELERRSSEYEETIKELSAITERLVEITARGAESRAPARRPTARRRRHRTIG